MFDGCDQEDRFGKILSSVLKSLPPAVSAVIGSKDDIGTHSTRKGSSSYALSFPSGPSPISVFQRAKWSLGNTQDRYLHQGEGADQVRVMNGVCE